MSIKLPKKCFISHAYADAAVRDRLIANLPGNIDAFVFPPITVDPTQLVSGTLVESLVDCDGLIFIEGGYSERSFWVAFERDYALRMGKKVFAANPSTLEITPYTGRALDLAVFASYHRKDISRVREVADFMRHERYFDLWLDVDDLQPGSNFEDEITLAIGSRLERGGYLVVFWSKEASQSEFIKKEYEYAIEENPDFNDRVLFALLEDVPIPEFWLRFNEPSVQLYGDTERAFTQRLDDLIVRLYWLIYRKTKLK